MMSKIQRDKYMQSFIKAYTEGYIRSLGKEWESDCEGCNGGCPAQLTCLEFAKDGDLEKFKQKYSYMIQYYPELLI